LGMAKVTMMAKATMVAATMVRLLWHCHSSFYPSYLIVIKKILRITPNFEQVVLRPPPPSAHLRLFWRKKNIKFLFPATTIESITRVNSLHKASNSLILMAINALVAICLIHLLPLAKF
jgi:hypothetical protein